MAQTWLFFISLPLPSHQNCLGFFNCSNTHTHIYSEPIYKYSFFPLTFGEKPSQASNPALSSVQCKCHILRSVTFCALGNLEENSRRGIHQTTVGAQFWYLGKVSFPTPSTSTLIGKNSDREI